jgi:hypothetical protein
MALGATMLLVALAQVARRHLATAAAAKTVTPPATPEPAAPAAPTTESPAAPPQRAQPSFAGPPSGDCSLALLLRRLQSAGDQLEEVAGDLRGSDRARDDSGLKEPPAAVEYVFRASGP